MKKISNDIVIKISKKASNKIQLCSHVFARLTT